MHYWREKDAEVDLVVDKKTGVLPIEIKYRSDARSPGLPVFRRTFAGMSIPVSVVITKDRLDSDRDTLYIPFWLAH